MGSSGDQWLEIQPRSCRALLPKMMQQGESLELILAENVSINDVPQSTFYLERMADAKSHTGRFVRVVHLLVSVSSEQHLALNVKSSYRGEMKMHDGVTKQVTSYTSDSTTALVIGEQIKAEHSSEAYPKRRSESVIDMRIRNLEISLVDGMPMEVLLLSIDEMALFTANGVSDGSSSAFVLNVKSIQLDDQVAYSQVPVVISHQVWPARIEHHIHKNLMLCMFTMCTGHWDTIAGLSLSVPRLRREYNDPITHRSYHDERAPQHRFT